MLDITLGSEIREKLLRQEPQSWPDILYASLWNGGEIDYHARQPIQTACPYAQNDSLVVPWLTRVAWDAIPCVILGVAAFADPYTPIPLFTIELPALKDMTVTIEP